MSAPVPLRVAFAGTPEFALPALRGLLHSQHQVVGVLTQPDRPSGRGRQLTAPPVKQAAQSHVPPVPVAQPVALKEPADWAPLRAWRPDVLVVIAYGLIIPQPVLDLPALGCINVHASLLPRWRGAAPIERALLAGDRETGLTVMRMEAGLDTGPMLLQERVPIEPHDTGASLRARLADLSAPLLLRALAGLAEGTLAAVPQPAQGVTYARKLEKSEARIDWQWPAEQIERLVRALPPWARADTVRIDPRTGAAERLIVHAARIASEGACTPAAPGCIVQVLGKQAEGYIRVHCGEGCLDLLVLQRPGGAPQSAGVFARGQHALAVGEQLGAAR